MLNIEKLISFVQFQSFIIRFYGNSEALRKAFHMRKISSGISFQIHQKYF